MKACGVGGDADEVLHPCGAAQFASARSCSSNASGLLSGTNLFHLDAHVERVSQHLDELSEVHSFVGDIVEDGLVAVALIFHVTNLHLQFQVFCNLAALNHGAVFAAFGFEILVHIHLFRMAIDAFDVVWRLDVHLFQLQFHKSARECHHSDVVSGAGLHGNDVAFLEVQVVDVVIITFARVLELHLHQVGVFCVSRDVG